MSSKQHTDINPGDLLNYDTAILKLAPVIGTKEPLSDEQAECLLGLSDEYKKRCEADEERLEALRKAIPPQTDISKIDFSNGYVSAKTFHQQVKSAKAMYEFLFFKEHCLAGAFVHAMCGYYLERDLRMRLEKELSPDDHADTISAMLPKEQVDIENTITRRTQMATEAKQEKVLENWKAAFKIMVPVILQCHANGPKKRTKAELQSMCSRHGGELTATQLDFLRDCLPDEHVNREGGASVQD